MATSIARAPGRAGELVLRSDGDHLELISNGVFLMDTRDGRSERLLVRAAVAAATRPVRRILLGGLGLGFSLAEALAVPGVERVVVVEVERAVVAWNRDHAAPVTGGSVDAAGVECVVADLVAWLRDPSQTADAGPFDAICLDIDNGPDWLVTDDNAWLYGDEGLAALRDRLRPGGALTVWSSRPVTTFRARLGHHFAAVGSIDLEVARGEPDTIYHARR
jgi:spermidine synthase